MSVTAVMIIRSMPDSLPLPELICGSLHSAISLADDLLLCWFSDSGNNLTLSIGHEDIEWEAEIEGADTGGTTRFTGDVFPRELVELIEEIYREQAYAPDS